MRPRQRCSASSRRTQTSLRDPQASGDRARRARAAARRSNLGAAARTRIDETILDDGTVKDDASAALRRIRRELRSAQGELIRILEREMGRLEPHHRVADMSVTMRNGRYVIPVRREGRERRRRHRARHVGERLRRCSSSRRRRWKLGNRMRELEAEELRGDRAHSPRADRRAAAAPRRAHRDARCARRARLAVRARALRDRSSRVRRRRSLPARDGFEITTAATRCCSRRARDVVPFDLAMEPASARCSFPARTPAARRCCSRRSALHLGAGASRVFRRRLVPGAASRSSTMLRRHRRRAVDRGEPLDVQRAPAESRRDLYGATARLARADRRTRLRHRSDRRRGARRRDSRDAHARAAP